MGKAKRMPGDSNPAKKADENEMVLTPGGWRPRSMVNILQEGYHLSGKGGRMSIIETATGKLIKDLGPKSTVKRVNHIVAEKKNLTVPATLDIGWIENSQWQNNSGQPIVYFSTKWIVPPVPASDDDQVIFLFNGLQPADSTHILQPVLQWGAANGTGKIWSITNWYANGQGGAATTKTPVQVNPGDVLQGVMTLTGQSGTEFSYKSSFVGHSEVDVDVTDVDELTWAFETLEAYGSTDETKPLVQCSDFPDTPLTAFYEIEIKVGTSLAAGTDATINWSAVTNFTDCGQQCSIISNASPGGIVYLYYRTLTQNLYFVVDKSTFGVDEVKDILLTSGGNYPDSFWVMLEGFTINQLGAATVSLTGTFPSFSDIDSILQDGPPIFENAGQPDLPQRIRFAFSIKFKSANSFPASSPLFESLIASITINGTTLNAQTEIELVSGADPYFTNIDPNNNAFYLSQDLRLFSAAAGDTILGGPSFSSDPYGSIQSLLGYLNSTDAFTVPSNADPLNNLPGQSSYDTADSSVTPLNGAGQPNYNFALARVRLQDAGGSSVPDIRVFFRLFVAQSCDTDFQPSTTYQTITDTAGNIVPIQSGVSSDPSGQTLQTIPFFATGNADSDYDGSTANGNIQTISIPIGQDSVWKYFGCYLDVFNASNQSKFPGTHHCIIAEINFSGAPIINSGGVTMSPENSDKLAQRNLQITSSGNPGYPATHRIPQAFDMRPSVATNASKGLLLNYSDELMIDWGNTPSGSIASIYWPQVNAADVLQLASKSYLSRPLIKSDANTITCQANGGVTYIPIPFGVGKNFAGLFTVDLPSGIVVGQEFNIIVRRITSRQFPRDTAIPATEGNENRSTGYGNKGGINWRYITGSFQIKIPVERDDKLLPQEENTLSILKWRLANMSPVYRWYPVVQRMISYMNKRVSGFGGNPSDIPPSLYGLPPKGSCHSKELHFDGKICEVIFNCFGEFEGFVLEQCSGQQRFKSCEKAIGELCLRACRERLTVTIYTNEKNKIQKIVIHC